MRSLSSLLSVAVLAALLAGCGAGSAGSADDFRNGDEKAVAQVVDDLSQAARDRDGREVCTSLLAKEAVAKLQDGTRDCAAVMQDQLSDASPNYVVDVQDVTVTGDTATAKVESPVFGEQRTQTLRFVREGQAWRLAGS